MIDNFKVISDYQTKMPRVHLLSVVSFKGPCSHSSLTPREVVLLLVSNESFCFSYNPKDVASNLLYFGRYSGICSTSKLVLFLYQFWFSHVCTVCPRKIGYGDIRTIYKNRVRHICEFIIFWSNISTTLVILCKYHVNQSNSFEDVAMSGNTNKTQNLEFYRWFCKIPRNAVEPNKWFRLGTSDGEGVIFILIQIILHS